LGGGVGSGFGLGSYIIDSQTKASKSSSNLVIQRRSSFVDENVEKSLVRSEGRDFAGASILLRRHSNNHAFIMMYSNDISRIAYEKHFPRIHDWMWVGDVDDKFGHQVNLPFAFILFPLTRSLVSFSTNETVGLQLFLRLQTIRSRSSIPRHQRQRRTTSQALAHPKHMPDSSSKNSESSTLRPNLCQSPRLLPRSLPTKS